jgi:hypothetical protein
VRALHWLAEKPGAFQGSFWAGSDGKDEAAHFDRFTQAVAPSTMLLGQVIEYSIPKYPLQTGVFVGSRIVSSSTPPASVADSAIQAFIQAQIDSGAASQPDAGAVYAVFLPPGTKVSGQERELGYHSYSSGMRSSFHYLMLRFDPYLIDPIGRLVTEVTFSHEMAESITDPDLNAWFDDATGNEIGDVCQMQIGHIAGYTVQEEWSNEHGRCIDPQDVYRPPSGGCPAGMHLEDGYCVPNQPVGCSSSAGGGLWPAAAALAFALLCRRRLVDTR